MRISFFAYFASCRMQRFIVECIVYSFIMLQKKGATFRTILIAIGFSLGQLIYRPPLHLTMLFLGATNNDEPIAADLLGIPHEALILPLFILYTAASLAVVWKMRRVGLGCGAFGFAFLACALGVVTILVLDLLLYGQRIF